MNYPDYIWQFCGRLAGVVIENRPAIQVMLAHDSEHTLHYVDPPYVMSTRVFRGRNHGYRYEMTDQDHVELAATLHALKGSVVLSGYRNEMYDTLYGDWKRVDKETLADGAKPRIESLWIKAIS